MHNLWLSHWKSVVHIHFMDFKNNMFNLVLVVFTHRYLLSMFICLSEMCYPNLYFTSTNIRVSKHVCSVICHSRQMGNQSYTKDVINTNTTSGDYR